MGDTGALVSGAGGRVEVRDAQVAAGYVLHVGEVTGALAVSAILEVCFFVVHVSVIITVVSVCSVL